MAYPPVAPAVVPADPQQSPTGRSGPQVPHRSASQKRAVNAVAEMRLRISQMEGELGQAAKQAQKISVTISGEDLATLERIKLYKKTWAEIHQSRLNATSSAPTGQSNATQNSRDRSPASTHNATQNSRDRSPASTHRTLPLPRRRPAPGDVLAAARRERSDERYLSRGMLPPKWFAAAGDWEIAYRSVGTSVGSSLPGSDVATPREDGSERLQDFEGREVEEQQAQKEQGEQGGQAFQQARVGGASCVGGTEELEQRRQQRRRQQEELRALKVQLEEIRQSGVSDNETQAEAEASTSETGQLQTTSDGIINRIDEFEKLVSNRIDDLEKSVTALNSQVLLDPGIASKKSPIAEVGVSDMRATSNKSPNSGPMERGPQRKQRQQQSTRLLRSLSVGSCIQGKENIGSSTRNARDSPPPRYFRLAKHWPYLDAYTDPRGFDAKFTTPVKQTHYMADL